MQTTAASAFHGLAAFRGTKNAMIQRLAARACIGAEVCVADRPIGAVGLCLSGKITQAFWGDCWSERTKEGSRWTDRTDQLALETPSEAEYYRLCRDWVASTGSDHAYCEAWMIPDAIDYVWVKRWASDAVKRNARLMAKLLKKQLIEVDGTTHVYDSHAPYEADAEPYPYEEWETA